MPFMGVTEIIIDLLIIYGLITETSIKALFTGAFVPGFMQASFIIIYIVIRTQLHPDHAPLPEPVEGEPQGAEKLALFGAFCVRAPLFRPRS